MGSYRWLILAAGTLSATSLSAVQIGISAIVPELRSHFDLSLGQIGIVLGATNAGMTATVLAWGFVSDRIGERRAIAYGLSGTAAALAVASTVHSFAALTLLLALAGASGVSVNSASGRAVMHWFPRQERGLALGIRQAAIPLGGFAGALVLPHLSVEAAFLALAAYAAVLALVAVAVLRERPHHDEVSDHPSSPLRDRRLWLLCTASAFVIAGQLAIMGFVVLFLHDARGLSTATAALVLAGVQVGGAFLRIAGGRASDRTGRRIPLFRAFATLCGLTLGAAAVLVGAPLVVLIPVLVVAGSFGMSWNGLSFTAAAEVAGPRRSGAAIGFQQMVLGVGGIVVPIAFVAVLGATSWRVVFFACAAAPLVGAALLRPLRSL